MQKDFSKEQIWGIPMIKKRKQTDKEVIRENYFASETDYGYFENFYDNANTERCARCRIRYIDYSCNSKSIFCRECREELLQFKIPKSIKVFCLVVIMMVLLCILGTNILIL